MALHPFFWVTSWVACNIVLTLLNKSVFTFVRFPYPMTLSFVHMVVSGLFSHIVIAYLKWVPAEKIDEDYQKRLVYFSGLFTLNIIFGNLSLKVATVSFGQVVRSIIPAFCMVLSYVLIGKTYSKEARYSLIPVILGVALSTYGEVNFNLVGLIILLLGCLLAGLKVVLSTKFLVGKVKLHPIELLRRMSPLAALQMLALAFIFGEIDGIRENAVHVFSLPCMLMVFATGFISFFLNYTNFMTNKTTSPVTLSVAGNLKTALTIALSFMIFQNPLTFSNLLGIGVTIIGTIIYSHFELKALEAERQLQAARKLLESESSNETSILLSGSSSSSGGGSGVSNVNNNNNNNN